MPIGTLVTDDYLKRFIEVTNHLSAAKREKFRLNHVGTKLNEAELQASEGR